MTKIRPKLLAVTMLGALLSLSCIGGGSDSGAVEYEAEEVIAIVQGWPLLHPNDFICGTATIPERTIISLVGRVEYLDFDVGCGADSDGSSARRAVRLALTDTSWSATEDGDGRWLVSADPGTGRRYEWTFLESGPQLLASGGDALFWSLFNWSSSAQP